MSITLNLYEKNEEYIENLQDKSLKNEIGKSKELDSLLSNIKL